MTKRIRCTRNCGSTVTDAPFYRTHIVCPSCGAKAKMTKIKPKSI